MSTRAARFATTSAWPRPKAAPSRSIAADSRRCFTPRARTAASVLRFCSKHKADVNLGDPTDVAPMSVAMLNANWDIAKALVEAGADVNHWDWFGRSPLHVAIANLSVANVRNPLDNDRRNQATGRELVKLLVERGANPNQQQHFGAGGFGAAGDRGLTPFLIAARSGDIEIREIAARTRRQCAPGDRRWPRPDSHGGELARRWPRRSLCE